LDQLLPAILPESIKQGGFKMKVQRVVIAMVIVILLTTMGVVSALAQEKITMKIATVWGTDDIACNKALNYLKPRIEQLTKGQVAVELHKGTLGGERSLYEGVQLGSIQAGAMTTGPLWGFIPLAEIFMVPFLFNDWNHAWASVDGPLGDHFNELALKRGMRFLGWWGTGGRNIYGNGKPVIHPSDLKGRKIRVMETPFLVELYRHYGALPTPMSFKEVYTALQQGVIDGVQAGLGAASVHHQEVSKWMTIIEENLSLVPFSVSERWWSKLPDNVKGAIRQAVLEATVVHRVLLERDEQELKKVWTAAGVKMLTGDRKAFRKLAIELYPKFAQMLGGDEWLQWIANVGEAFPIKEYKVIKKYNADYKF
jgi:TRAP-type C4-dicarboxylate transport system substrate-binding protein